MSADACDDSFEPPGGYKLVCWNCAESVDEEACFDDGNWEVCNNNNVSSLHITQYIVARVTTVAQGNMGNYLMIYIGPVFFISWITDKPNAHLVKSEKKNLFLFFPDQKKSVSKKNN